MAAKLKKEIADYLGSEKKLFELSAEAFKIADEDNSGYLDKIEVREILTGLAADLGNDPPTSQQMDEAWNDLEVDGDGRITNKEFMNLIRNLLQSLYDSL
ncbi:unnamed protein product [Moneuplotes crassus]|uniref:EF-hand domain-containing protein n=1 Tax=Euplotes crassus TaxID=5936 RepID=A0AAD1XYS7_EUPCR|nr:unnamed protein product [Moneuplotes crassus]